MEEVAAAKHAMEKGANPKDFKARLAREIVTLYHGSEAAKRAEEEFGRVFKDKGVPDDVPELKVKKGTLLIDALVQGKLAASKSEARRLIEQGGVSIDGIVVSTVDAKAEVGLVKVGKRKFMRIKT
jgi:tyrosyl-tRNA synthetase